ncbi:MAG TPA: glycosyltransferase [Stellaceae bacterium]|nr:glycosyltransferase [Stellaceae bacterium]
MPIWVQLGHALKEADDYAGAETAYRQALALDAGAADTHLQLGHLLKLRQRRGAAIDAYAAAVRLDPDLVAAREALLAVLGYSPSEVDRALMAGAAGAVAVPGPATDAHRPLTPADRYGALFADASRKAGAGYDVIWLGVIDWHYRIQRPQHLAANLADMGARIFYVSLAFEEADEKGRFRIIDMPHPGVFEIRVRLLGDPFESVHRGFSEAAVGELQLALDELIDVLGIRSPVILAEHPGWHGVACGVAGATVVYDCLDLATGFTDAPRSLAVAEAAMLSNADVVIVASQPLSDRVAPRRSNLVIRNAAEVDFFARGCTDRVAGEHPVIGYFGAIADWFNIAWIEACAVAHPNWNFRLIGRPAGCDISRAAQRPNVRFYDEKPYHELPLLLRDFDVAIIPFKINELTRYTNPVKLYEYMAAGKPVVASRMPEVSEATGLVYIADDAHSFADRIAQALAEDSPTLRAQRQAWASEHTWSGRARQLAQAIDASFPLVSVVIRGDALAEQTNACLFAVRSWSDYPNLEIIVIAQTSAGDGRLRELQQRDNRLRVILSHQEPGSDVAGQAALRAASGEYVVLLNDDMCVTRGWVRDLIRPMQLDPKIGLTGPMTNKIGGEDKPNFAYRTMPEMREWARRFVRCRIRGTSEVEALAFSCVAIRRSVLQAVGLTDDAPGGGRLDDEDHCRRVRQANHKLVIAHDVFVHRRGVAADVQIDRPAAARSTLPAPAESRGEVEWLPLMTVGPAGERSDAGVSAKPGQAGHLVYGPYVRLGAGAYRVRIRWIAGRPPPNPRHDQPVAAIEAVSGDGNSYLAQRRLMAEECTRPEHELLFGLGESELRRSAIEVRIWTSGAMPLTVSSITVERISGPARPA